MSTAVRERLRKGAGRVLLVLLILSAGAGVLWYRRLGQGGAPSLPPALPDEPASTAEMISRDFRHVETKMDRTMWVLEAKRAEIKGETALLTTVKITWYGEPGDLPVVITSQSGRMEFATRNALLNGAVRLVRSDGAVLETERLVWTEEYRVLRAPLPVTITTPNFTFKGRSLIANIDKQWVKLIGQVEGEIRGASPAALSPS